MNFKFNEVCLPISVDADISSGGFAISELPFDSTCVAELSSNANIPTKIKIAAGLQGIKAGFYSFSLDVENPPEVTSFGSSDSRRRVLSVDEDSESASDEASDVEALYKEEYKKLSRASKRKLQAQQSGSQYGPGSWRIVYTV